jgi:hypothetical protein
MRNFFQNYRKISRIYTRKKAFIHNFWVKKFLKIVEKIISLHPF